MRDHTASCTSRPATCSSLGHLPPRALELDQQALGALWIVDTRLVAEEPYRGAERLVRVAVLEQHFRSMDPQHGGENREPVASRRAVNRGRRRIHRIGGGPRCAG